MFYRFPTNIFPMILISRAAEVTGIPEATLRIWERRYGIGANHRTETGYRLYDTLDILAIKEMQRLINTGFSVKAAANAVKSNFHQDLKSAVALGGSKGKFALELTEKFFTSISNLDDLVLGDVLSEVFEVDEFENVIDNWLSPTLIELGRRWHEGELDISSEHFASGAIMRKLSKYFEESNQLQTGPRVIVGAPKGSAHEIGSLAFAVSARRMGMQVVYLGVEVPPETWVEASEKHGAEAIVISVKISKDVAFAQECVDLVRKKLPDLKIAIGGTMAEKISGGDLVLIGGIGTSTSTLWKLLS